jgi:hypothetical protein
MSDHRVLFEHDPEIGRTVWLVFDDKGNMKGAHVEQEVDAILEANKMWSDISAGTRFGDYNRIASVPLTFLEKTGLGEAIDQRDKRYYARILNDSDYSGFRTSRGRV